jgi:uncharacterized protein (TIGR03435 family)
MIRACLLVVVASTMCGQSFDVASIKLHEGPPLRLAITTSGQRLTADCSNVATLMMNAYNLKVPMVSASPLVRDGEPCWDIMAKAEGDAVPTNAQFRQMLKSLLAERFQLKVHTEMRETPVYALVVGKGGMKFKESDPDADATGHYDMKGRNIVITYARAGMSDIVHAVTNALLDRLVVDHTGLTGTYNITLTYTPNYRANRESEPDLGDITVFQAIEEQLGLKLEARKEPVEVLVVDNVEKPTAN